MDLSTEATGGPMNGILVRKPAFPITIFRRSRSAAKKRRSASAMVVASEPAYLVSESARKTVTKLVVLTTISANPVTTVCWVQVYISHCDEPAECQEGEQKKEHTNNPGALANEEQRSVHDGELLRWCGQGLAFVGEGVDVCDHHGSANDLGHGPRTEGGKCGEDGEPHLDCSYEVLGISGSGH